MTWRSRRRGVFERLPRVLYRRTGARYVDACAVAAAVNGVVVALFGVVTVVLYVDLGAGELAVFAACWATFYLVEGLIAAVYVRRAAVPVRADAQQAWLAAARLPLDLLRRRSLNAIGAAGAVGAGLVLAALLDLEAYEGLLLLPVSLLLYLSSVVLRYIALELAMRPVLEAVGESESAPDFTWWVSLHRRRLATVPMVTWGAAVVVAGLLTEDTRELETIALAGVGAGDLSVRVPVVCTDETGELSASFNAMVAGLEERERLRHAFGTFVDPALTERVLAEVTDLRGEEVDVSVLFLDVRGFTPFASAPRRTRSSPPSTSSPRLVGEGAGGKLRVGVGVNSGRVVVGTIGGGERRDFTVIGAAVNTAARVEAATRVTGDDILITETTLRALGPLGDDFEERSSVPLKGMTKNVRLYAPRRTTP